MSSILLLLLLLLLLFATPAALLASCKLQTERPFFTAAILCPVADMYYGEGLLSPVRPTISSSDRSSLVIKVAVPLGQAGCMPTAVHAVSTSTDSLLLPYRSVRQHAGIM
jgi:hypothetical protein